MDGDGEHPAEISNADVKRLCKVSDFRTETAAISNRCAVCGGRSYVKFYFRFEIKIRQYLCGPEGSDPPLMFKEFDYPTTSEEIRVGLPRVLTDDVRDLLIGCLQDFKIESSQLQSLVDEAVRIAREHGESMPEGNKVISVTSYNSLRHDHFYHHRHWATVLAKKAGMPPEEKCSICLEDYSENTEASELKCGHRFHVDCMMKWLENRHNCPECRYEWKGDLLTAWKCLPSNSNGVR